MSWGQIKCLYGGCSATTTAPNTIALSGRNYTVRWKGASIQGDTAYVFRSVDGGEHYLIGSAVGDTILVDTTTVAGVEYEYLVASADGGTVYDHGTWRAGLKELSSLTFAQSVVDSTLHIRDMAVWEGAAYVALLREIAKFDVTDPANPLYLFSRTDIPADVLKMELDPAHERLYVLTPYYLMILDTSNPAGLPRLCPDIPLSQSSMIDRDFVVDGELLYVGDAEQGLRAFDVSSMTHVVDIGVYYGPGAQGEWVFTKVLKNGDLLYVRSSAAAGTETRREVIKPHITYTPFPPEETCEFEALCERSEPCWNGQSFPGRQNPSFWGANVGGRAKGAYAMAHGDAVTFDRITVMRDSFSPTIVGMVPCWQEPSRCPLEWGDYDFDSRYVYAGKNVQKPLSFDQAFYMFDIWHGGDDPIYIVGDTLGQSWGGVIRSRERFVYTVDRFRANGSPEIVARLRVFEKPFFCEPDPEAPIRIVPDQEAYRIGEPVGIVSMVGCPLQIDVDVVEDGSSAVPIGSTSYASADDISGYTHWVVTPISSDMENHSYEIRVTATTTQGSDLQFYSLPFRIERGAVIEVSADGSGQFQTIQEGIDAAESGDTVRVAAGAYLGPVILKSNVHVIGPIGETTTATITNAQGGTVVTADGLLYPPKIVGFTITGEVGNSAQGMLIRDCGVRVESCRFEGLSAGSGGAVRIEGGWPEFRSCEFIDNTATADGGAVSLDAAVAYDSTAAQTTFIDSWFEGNSGLAAAAVDVGGNCRPRFERCTFVGHTVASGGAVVAGPDAGGEFVGCTFITASGTGGHSVLSMGGITGVGSSVLVDQSLFAFNAQADAIAPQYASGCDVRHSDFFGNNESDVYWLSAGEGNLNEDPAFCDLPGGDFRVYASSGCAPGAATDEGIGSFGIGCVPDAVVSSRPSVYAGDSTLTVACPAGDSYALEVSVALDSTVVTRAVAADEFVLGVQGAPFKVFSATGDVRAVEGASAATQWTARFSNAGLGGYGEDSLTVLLNGSALTGVAPARIATYDETGDGVVGIVDLGLFSQSPNSPPKPYVWHRDYDGDGDIDIGDVGLFTTHYGHGTANPPASATPSEGPVAPPLRIALEFTEEYLTPSDRRLYVDVKLEQIVPFVVAATSFRHANPDLVFEGWQPSSSYPRDRVVVPVTRDGVPELFMYVVGVKDYTVPQAELGRMVFRVASSEPLEIAPEDFELRVGDAWLVGQQRGTLRGVGASRSEETRRVFHDYLAQNYPNPFNPTTTIEYTVAKREKVRLAIYNVAGQLVQALVDEEQEPNRYRIGWEGTNRRGNRVASGVYFCRLTAGSFSATKKMVLIR